MNNRLRFYGLDELEVRGDGSCQARMLVEYGFCVSSGSVLRSLPHRPQFRAVADQLFRNQELHGEVRRQAVEELRANQVRLRQRLSSAGPLNGWCMYPMLAVITLRRATVSANSSAAAGPLLAVHWRRQPI